MGSLGVNASQFHRMFIGRFQNSSRRLQWAQIGSRAFTLPASPPGTKLPFWMDESRPAQASAFDATGDTPRPGPDGLNSGQERPFSLVAEPGTNLLADLASVV